MVEAGAVQPSLFDVRDLAEITAPDYPGERLVVCRNPMLADERARKRGELLDATEKKLIAIQGRVRRAKKPLRGAAGQDRARNRRRDRPLQNGQALRPRHHGRRCHVRAQTAQINAEAALDGIYVLRTSLKPETLDAASTVKTYKQLAQVEEGVNPSRTPSYAHHAA